MSVFFKIIDYLAEAGRKNGRWPAALPWHAGRSEKSRYLASVVRRTAGGRLLTGQSRLCKHQLGLQTDLCGQFHQTQRTGGAGFADIDPHRHTFAGQIQGQQRDFQFLLKRQGAGRASYFLCQCKFSAKIGA